MLFFASLGLGASIYENRDAIEDAFTDYLQTQEFYGEQYGSMQDTCIQVYNSNTNTKQDISWQDVWESLHEFHDEAVDNLTGIYVKYCPQLLGICNDFVGDVLDGDIYIAGISNTIAEYENIAEEDIEAQQSGKLYTASFITHSSCVYTNPYFRYPEFRMEERWFSEDVNYFAGTFRKSIFVADCVRYFALSAR